MSWKFEPHSSIGPIKFGMKRSEVQACLSDYGLLSSNGNFASNGMPTDEYEGFSVLYSKYNQCDAIQIESKAILFDGKPVLETPWEEIIQLILRKDENAKVEVNEICSHKLGIQVTRDPSSDRVGKVFLFEADYYFLYKEVPHPTKASSLYIQVGFIEDVDFDVSSFHRLEDAAKTIFASTKERGIILWNTIPVAFNYRTDFPEIIRKITPVLREMHWAESGDELFSISTENLDFGWRIKWDKDTVNINSDWRKTPGGLAKALMSESTKKVIVTKQDFMNEWKMLFKQFNRMIESTDVSFSEIDSQEVVSEAKNLEVYIEGIGKCYQNTSESIYNAPEHRKQTIKRMIIAVVLFILSLIALWFVSKETGDEPFIWVKKHWFWLVLTPFIIFNFLLLPPFLLRKK